MIIGNRRPPSTSLHGPRGPTYPNLSGVLLAVLGVGVFALIFVAGRLSETGITALQVMWFRYAGGVVTVTVVGLLTRGPGPMLRTGQWGVHAARAACGGLGGVATIHATTHMPVASASAVGLLDGLFTLILAALVLGERAGPRQWLATLLAVAGALVVLGAQGAFEQWHGAFAMPALIGAAGAALFAVESILIKRLVHAERALAVLFYVNLFGCVILLLPAIATWQPLSTGWTLAFLGLGPLAIAAQYCNVLAFRRTTAGVAAAARYAWILHATLLGWLFFAQAVTAAIAVGLAIVAAAGCWLALQRR